MFMIASGTFSGSAPHGKEKMLAAIVQCSEHDTARFCLFLVTDYSFKRMGTSAMSSPHKSNAVRNSTCIRSVSPPRYK